MCLEHNDADLFGYTVARLVAFGEAVYRQELWFDSKGGSMRTLPFITFRPNVNLFLRCLLVLTALGLVGITPIPTITEGKNVNRAATAVPQKAPLDFDGDGKTDYTVVRVAGGAFIWYIQRSMLGVLGQTWGTSTTDTPVPGDYDGDGKWDIAVWRLGNPATFYILRSTTGTLQSFVFGQTGDNPLITQDFDGDLKADPAVARNVGGTFTWLVQRSALGFVSYTFGNVTTDLPIRGDYDGDGKADVAVYRTHLGNPNNTFFVLRSSDFGVQTRTFGLLGDNIIPADFDGDGKTDYAVWRGAGSGFWYWLRSSDGAFRALSFGSLGDFPVPGDYDGDGTTDQAVWRPGIPANFYVNRSMLGFTSLTFGQTTDSATAFTLQVR